MLSATLSATHFSKMCIRHRNEQLMELFFNINNLVLLTNDIKWHLDKF